MQMSNLFRWLPGSLAVWGAAVALLAVSSPRAWAYGGLWSSETAAVAQTSEHVLFVDNPDSTVTAVVQVGYAGPPQELVWLIPVAGEPTVSLSSSVVFQRLEAAAAPQYWVEVGVEGTCASQDGGPAGDGEGSAYTPDQAVEMIAGGAVGPYDYVTLAPDASLADPAQAAIDWLAMHGYRSTRLDRDALSPYVGNGLHLLALKVRGGAETDTLRPIMLTYPSERPTIPLGPTAVAAREDMGMVVWVIGPSQAVPANYRSLVLNDARLDWLSAHRFNAGTLPSGGDGTFGLRIQEPSNYDALVSAAADEAGGRGFVTELAAPASQFRDRVWSSLDDERFASIVGQRYDDGIDAVLTAGQAYRGWDGWKEAVDGATTLPADVTVEQFAGDPESYRGVAEVDTARFVELLEQKVVKPVVDTAALLYRGPYLTRLYTALSSEEMTVDPSFDYNPDLAQVSNVHVAKQFIECGPGVTQSEAPWRMELPQGGVVVGEEDGEWPLAEASMPATLKIVDLSASGAGAVVEDNSERIGRTLFEMAGMSGTGAAVPPPPHQGVRIGGTQTVTTEPPSAGADGEPAEPSGGKGCRVSPAGARAGTLWTLGLPFAAAILARCGRRSRRARPGVGAKGARGR